MGTRMPLRRQWLGWFGWCRCGAGAPASRARGLIPALSRRRGPLLGLHPPRVRRPGKGGRPRVLHRPHPGWPDGRPVGPYFEGQPGPLRIPHVDALAVVDVDHRHAVAVDVRSVQRSVVDRHPSALIKAQDQVRAGYPRVRDAQVGVQITPDDHLMARCEGLLGSVVPDRQYRRGWSTHYTSIGPRPECSPLDAPVTWLCLNLATHSCLIAGVGPLPMRVRHDSNVMGVNKVNSGSRSGAVWVAATKHRIPSRHRRPGYVAAHQVVAVVSVPAAKAEKRGGTHGWTR